MMMLSIICDSNGDNHNHTLGKSSFLADLSTRVAFNTALLPFRFFADNRYVCFCEDHNLITATE
jgi:hypothetical protein